MSGQVSSPSWATPHPPLVGGFGLQRGSGPAMGVIRLGTFSRYGHAVICVGPPQPDGRVLIVQAMPSGAQSKLVDPRHYAWSNVALADSQRQVVRDTALGCVGLGYDWAAIAGFLVRFWGVKLRGHSTEHPDHRLMCSELVVWCYRQAGIDLAPGVAAGDVSPGDLAQVLVLDC